jgi:hypothetical protein
MRIKIKKPEYSRFGVKLYAEVFSGSQLIAHTVVYIRKAGMRRWLCDCRAQLFIETGRHRNCKHIRGVRRKVAL